MQFLFRVFLSGFSASCLVLGVGAARAQQSQHIENAVYDYDLAPGQEVAATLECRQGDLLSGGAVVNNASFIVRVIRDYPTVANGVFYWRADIRNFGSFPLAGKFNISVLCTGVGAAVAADFGGVIWLYAKSHDAPGSGNAVYNTYTVSGAGGALVAITASPPDKEWDNVNAAVSPDGQTFAFESYRHRDDPAFGNASELYLANADGSNEVRLSANTDILDDGPRWCGADRIVFSRDGNLAGIQPVDLDGDGNGDGLIPLTSGADYDYGVDCHVGADKLVFIREGAGPQRQVMMSAADGSSPVGLSGTTVVNETPRLSPDGTRIAFASTDHGGALRIVDVATGNVSGPVLSGDPAAFPTDWR